MPLTATMDTDTRHRERFAGLLDKHRGIVFKVVQTYSFHPDDQDDLAQEIAAQAWRAFPAYDGQRSFSTWMYRIALNVAISHVRSHTHRQRHCVALDDVLHEVVVQGMDFEADQQVRALHRFIAQQDPLNRALLLLYLEDHSYGDMADILGITQTNVATKISRLKQRIHNEL